MAGFAQDRRCSGAVPLLAVVLRQASRHWPPQQAPRHLVLSAARRRRGFSTSHAEVRHLVSGSFRWWFFGLIEVTRPDPADGYHCNRATALFDSLSADSFALPS